MKPPNTSQDLLNRRYGSASALLGKEVGQFNLFRLEPKPVGSNRQLPYRRRDYYKIMLVSGEVEFQYATKVVPIKEHALVFSNPQIPYKCQYLERIKGGCYCILNKPFYNTIQSINKYSVFRPEGDHIFELTTEAAQEVARVFDKMFDEIESNYIYKNDVLRNLVLELVHFAMKMQPSSSIDSVDMSASHRISMLLIELLERQFPIEENNAYLSLRSASEFATQLNVHVNHLNRSIKEITGKTTTQIINERILKEAQILLQQSHWNISQIAYALGFKESSHFNNFFKKHLNLSPTQYRRQS